MLQPLLALSRGAGEHVVPYAQLRKERTNNGDQACQAWRRTEWKQEAIDKAGLKAWKEWGKRNEAGIVVTDVMVGKTWRVTKTGFADGQNQIAGIVIVEAADIDAAGGLFQDHPHITIFPGDGILPRSYADNRQRHPARGRRNGSNARSGDGLSTDAVEGKHTRSDRPRFADCSCLAHSYRVSMETIRSHLPLTACRAARQLSTTLRTS